MKLTRMLTAGAGLALPLLGLATSLALAGLTYASAREISRQVPAVVVIRTVSLAEMADLDRSGTVDLADLRIVLASFGAAPPADLRADLDGNHLVDVRDLALVAQVFGVQVP